MANKISKRSCLECEIKDIDITIAKRCRGSFTCISFLFDNNTFFRQHSKIIHYLQEALQNKPMSTIFMITIQSDNLTEISFKYLNSLLYMNLPSYDILQVKFIKPMSGMEIMNVKKDISHIPIDVIYLVFSCNYHMRH
jgi:hypothetical protein